jgi:hypothetical protein
MRVFGGDTHEHYSARESKSYDSSVHHGFCSRRFRYTVVSTEFLMKRFRFQIGLRLLLLLMALACVLSAYYRASSDLRRERLREELFHLQVRERNIKHWGSPPEYQKELAEVSAEIDAQLQRLGESRAASK